MNLFHVKLVNGDDIICTIDKVDNDKETITISYPIQIISSPDHGTYGKNWLAMSANKYATIDVFNVMLINEASESAVETYIEFAKKMVSESMQELMDEAETSVKH